MMRRSFFGRLSIVLGGLATATVAVPVVGALLAPLLRKVPRVWYSIGDIDRFEVGKTVEVVFENASPLPWSGLTAQTAVWLRRENEDTFIAFAVNCTHLGCPVRWLPDSSLFMCPCHGGVYYRNGDVAAGPPPRPLVRYPVRLRARRVEVLTSPVPISTS